MENRIVRGSTVKAVRRGVKDYGIFAPDHLLPTLPQREVDVLEYVTFSIHFRGHEVHKRKNLDASTICGYVQSLGSYIEAMARGLRIPAHNAIKTRRVREFLTVAKDVYKKPSMAKHAWTIAEVRGMLERGFKANRSGRHRRLQLWFHLLGVLRKTAGSLLRVIYRKARGRIIWDPRSPVKVKTTAEGGRYIEVTVKDDKNVKAWKVRTSVIPEFVKALNLYPVKELEDYLLNDGPPSGSYLTAAPIGGKSAPRFSLKPYSGQSDAFRDGYARAHGASDTSMYGSQSARKSLAQWLWDDGWSKRHIADQGGWALQRDAVDIYFKTGAETLLWAVKHVGREQRRRLRKSGRANDERK